MMRGRTDYLFFPSPRAQFFISALSLIYATTIDASGFAVPGGLSIAGLGTADTLVANSVETGAFAYNPAAMSFHRDRSVALGIIGVWPTSRVTPEGENDTTSDDADSPIMVPNMYLMSSVSDSLSVGLGINAPFGLETNWKEGTFPQFTGPLAPLEPTKTRLEMFNVNPSLSYKLNNHFSIAGGLDYYRATDATSDTNGIDIHGDGQDFGWNAAMLYVLGRWSLGMSYQSAVNVGIDGEFDATKVLGFKVDSETEIKFPDIFRIGLRYQANEKLAVEFDFDRIGWSTFDEIEIKSKDSVPEAGVTSGSVLVRTVNNWRNTNSYHVSATYQILPKTQLRFGYTLNQNPQPESYFSPRYPNARRHLFSTGLKQEYKGWDLEAGILYGRWEDKTIDNDTPYTGGDANGTTVYNGKYELDGFLAGVGANFYF